MTPIVADDLKVESEPDGNVRVSMRVKIPLPAEFPTRIWFSSKEENLTTPNEGDPFFPSLLYFAWKNRLDLDIQAKVSRKMASAGREIIRIFSGWAGRDPEKTTTKVSCHDGVGGKAGEFSGALFSCGVDALYTVLRNLRINPSRSPLNIKRLYMAHGFDMEEEDMTLAEMSYSNAEAFASREGLELVKIRTNSRRFCGYSFGIWGRYGNGPCLAGILHSFPGKAHSIYIASSFWNGMLIPWASHPEIDPLWSSEQIIVIHDGIDTSRSEKINFLSKAGDALRFLKVCNPGGVKKGRLNCGQCEKCIRTMFALECCGALERAVHFPGKIEAENIRALKIKTVDDVLFWIDNLEFAKRNSANKNLIREVEALINRSSDIKNI